MTIADAIRAAGPEAVVAALLDLALRQAQRERRFDEPVTPPRSGAGLESYWKGATITPRLGGPSVEDLLAAYPRLVPDPAAVAARVRAKALRLAATTDETLTGKVRAVVARALERGTVYGAAGPLTGPEAVQTLLDSVGVTNRNPNYARLIFEVAANQARAEATHAAMREAGPDAFPVWRYVHGDSTVPRPHHLARDGRYYPNAVTFAEVRGDDIEEIAGCLCEPVPVGAAEWAALQADGATVEDVREFTERTPHEGQHATGEFTDAAGRKYRLQGGRRVPAGGAAVEEPR